MDQWDCDDRICRGVERMPGGGKICRSSYPGQVHRPSRARQTGGSDTAPNPAAPIVPGVPMPAIHVNCGGTQPYIDKAGNLWLPDEVKVPGASLKPVDGMTVERTEQYEIAGVQFPEIFQTERYSMSAYEFNLPNGKYTVRLHFAETYTGITGEGQRVFSFAVTGQLPVKDFDIFREAGGAYKAIVREYKGVAVTDGKLKIEFTANVQNPAINGIEIFAE